MESINYYKTDEWGYKIINDFISKYDRGEISDVKK